VLSEEKPGGRAAIRRTELLSRNGASDNLARVNMAAGCGAGSASLVEPLLWARGKRCATAPASPIVRSAREHSTLPRCIPSPPPGWGARVPVWLSAGTMVAMTPLRVLAVVATLHLMALSFAFGPRSAAYVLAAYLSAVTVWGSVFLMSQQRRHAEWVVGSLAIVIIQQIAYRVWKAELPGFWWPLVQFGTVQFVIAVGISGAAKRARRTAKFHRQ
jgi:hypothetical protein